MKDYEVWIDYMVDMCILRNQIHWHNINAKGVDETKCTFYPVLGIKASPVYNKEGFKIKTFKEFCEVDDERVSECLKGRKWRLN